MHIKNDFLYHACIIIDAQIHRLNLSLGVLTLILAKKTINHTA